MPAVNVELPGLLADILGVRSLTVDADTVRGALAAVVAECPALSTHLFDEQGELREHVLCFHNDTNTRWLKGGDVPVAAGDRITIMQAVSGG